MSEQLQLVAAHLPDLSATPADAQSEERHVFVSADIFFSKKKKLLDFVMSLFFGGGAKW